MAVYLACILGSLCHLGPRYFGLLSTLLVPYRCYHRLRFPPSRRRPRLNSLRSSTWSLSVIAEPFCYPLSDPSVAAHLSEAGLVTLRLAHLCLHPLPQQPGSDSLPLPSVWPIYEASPLLVPPLLWVSFRCPELFPRHDCPILWHINSEAPWVE
jgi:hypothetical protein